MSNHIHLIAVPHAPDALSRCLKHAHGRYAAYWNARQSSTGHVWQGRFYSCPLDDPHLWAALRYVELNPVRAGLCPTPEQWKWSSAAAHCALAVPDLMLDMRRWQQRWDAAAWQQFLGAPESDAEIRALRHSTYTGRPLGNADFLSALELSTSRRLIAKKSGRPKKFAHDPRQLHFQSAA
jgi:putative transposase